MLLLLILIVIGVCTGIIAYACCVTAGRADAYLMDETLMQTESINKGADSTKSVK